MVCYFTESGIPIVLPLRPMEGSVTAGSSWRCWLFCCWCALWRLWASLLCGCPIKWRIYNSSSMKVCPQPGHHDNEADLQNLTCFKQNLCFELSCSLISNTEVTEFEFIHRYDSSNSSIVHYIQFCIYWKIRLQNDQIKFFLINLMPLKAEFLTFDIHGS